MSKNANLSASLFDKECEEVFSKFYTKLIFDIVQIWACSTYATYIASLVILFQECWKLKIVFHDKILYEIFLKRLRLISKLAAYLQDKLVGRICGEVHKLWKQNARLKLSKINDHYPETKPQKIWHYHH